MRKIIPIFIFLLSFSLTTEAQLKWRYGKNKDRIAHNSVYAELMGNALTWSINYEREFKNIYVRIGGNYKDGDMLIPTIVSYALIRPENSLFVELGGGLLHKLVAKPRSYAFTEVNPSYEVFPTLSIALRFQPADYGFFGKLSFTPILDRERGGEYYFFGQEPPKIPVVIWGGVSVGFSF